MIIKGVIEAPRVAVSFPSVLIAEAAHDLHQARMRVGDVLAAPIWSHTGPEYEENRREWIEHGEREAIIAWLYLRTYGVPSHVKVDADPVDLMMGFILHDIGKTETMKPHMRFLLKEQLTADDMADIRRHVEAGEHILFQYEKHAGVHLPAMMRDIVLFHHEQLDGSGYPHNLSGQHLNFFGRLAACIDQLVGRTERRPYHTRNITLRAGGSRGRGSSSA